MAWKAHTLIHRIHAKDYGADEFNPTMKGNARFSPIQSAAGAVIPTLYGATTFEGAAMETVFRDVAYAPGLKTINKANKIDGNNYSILDPKTDLTLLDLTGLALRRIGVKHKDIIDTEKDTYPQTRLWAEACHTQVPKAQGMVWVSRQHNTTLAVILFEDRIPAGTLAIHQRAESVTLPPSGHYTKLLNLAQLLDARVV